MMMSPLWSARYFHTATKNAQLPPARWGEVVFAGRSNAGKSSAINVLCQQKQLAFSSRTPGRTQTVNFFSIGGGHPAQHRNDPINQDEIKGLLVDLPGYGYASVSQQKQSLWTDFLSSYIASRSTIVGLILLCDARRPLLPLDIQLLEWYSLQQKPVHILLTKADKINRSERALVMKECNQKLLALSSQQLTMQVSLQFFSTLKREGIDNTDTIIRTWLQLDTH